MVLYSSGRQMLIGHASEHLHLLLLQLYTLYIQGIRREESLIECAYSSLHLWNVGKRKHVVAGVYMVC